MLEVVKQTILLLSILIVPIVVTTPSAAFLNSTVGDILRYAEVIQLLLLGGGLFLFASLLRVRENENTVDFKLKASEMIDTI